MHLMYLVLRTAQEMGKEGRRRGGGERERLDPSDQILAERHLSEKSSSRRRQPERRNQARHGLRWFFLFFFASPLHSILF